MSVSGGQDWFDEGPGGWEGFYEGGDVGDSEEAVEETAEKDEGVEGWGMGGIGVGECCEGWARGRAFVWAGDTVEDSGVGGWGGHD